MERLTRNVLTETSPMYELGEWADNEEALDKLGQLEDIEGENGIDLITLFKSLEGIWVKSTNGDVYYVGSPYLCFSENEERKLELQFRVGDIWYKIKDCGKTWSLYKQELEQNGR